MIPPELEAKIVRLHHAEKWRVGTLARQLGVHHNTVRRVLAQAGLPAGRPSLRPSMVDPFVPFIIETLKAYPKLRASRLYEMVKARGYPGRPDHFRHIVARYRPRPPAEAYLRLRTLPGEQAQVDWGHFGKLDIGRARRPLMAFVMVLSWSRQIFVRFFLNQAMSNFLRGHVEAFSAFEGVPRVLLYDNLKSAVLERYADAIRFNPTLLSFAAHYRYEPRPVAIARGNEKGRVERAIQYIRHAFFAARTFADIDDLNAQARAWANGPSAERICPEDRSLTVGQAFAAEKDKLLALPDVPFDADERVEVRSGRTPYIRFDLNDYSVPHTCVKKTLTVVATEQQVRILDESEVVATHPRSFDKGQQIEKPEHIAELTAEKRAARRHRGMDRLHHAVPQSRDLLAAIAERGGNLGGSTTGLLRMLDTYGAVELEAAIAEVVERQVLHLSAVHQVLDRRRHQRGAPPPVRVTLPDDPRVKNIAVRPHDLSTYDAFTEERTDDNGHTPR